MKQVEYLLLDPSCSGSGIISRLDHLVDDDDENKGDYILLLCNIYHHDQLNKFLYNRKDSNGKDGNGQTQEERLSNLSDFQKSIIEHAMKCKYIRIHY